jgi:hypothetical protein
MPSLPNDLIAAFAPGPGVGANGPPLPLILTKTDFIPWSFAFSAAFFASIFSFFTIVFSIAFF